MAGDVQGGGQKNVPCFFFPRAVKKSCFKKRDEKYFNRTDYNFFDPESSPSRRMNAVLSSQAMTMCGITQRAHELSSQACHKPANK